jgi:hypothetical protein
MDLSGKRHAPAELYPQETTSLPIGYEGGWDSEPAWTQRLEEKSFDSVGDRTPVVQSVVSWLGGSLFYDAFSVTRLYIL